MNNILAKRVLRHTVDLAAAVLKIPGYALKMFRMADELSGLNHKTIPTELIPLNSIQLSRGLLNYTALQSLPGWVFPYWAERQFDPSDVAFIPRSHLGLSINITRRNWAAVGSPACEVEPVVDPRGAVMPFPNRWSLDVWVKTGEEVFFPSRHPLVRQRLRDGLPLVETSFDCSGVRIVETAYVDRSTLVVDVSAENVSGEAREILLAFAIRPFNPEGVAPVHDIQYSPEEHSFTIDKNEVLGLHKVPMAVHCSNRMEGDSAALFAGANGRPDQLAVSCTSGLANAYAAYAVSLGVGGKESLSATVPLGGGQEHREQGTPAVLAQVEESWRALLREGGGIFTPDERINMLLRSSICTLLLLTDGSDITPGPWTYHQFWFRDAAYMLRALDAFGFHEQAGRVIRSFPARQDRRGFFRSQQGEWDSNGQALWTIWQHTLLSGESRVARELFPAMRKGVEWIAKKRLTSPGDAGQPFAGLMPAGLSAEHLGLCDYYFWDNWWSAAGIQAFVHLAHSLGHQVEAGEATSLLKDYRSSIKQAIRFVREKRILQEIPAGPLRGIDSGMVGSCAAWYPLQELPPADEAMARTLAALSGRFTRKGLFFQDFIHSGGNPYLSLQLAHAWLYAGEREQFWRLFNEVVNSATPVLNYPEAIHPQTGGGAMGDGHHGWAAAEVAMALRGALIEEYWTPECDVPELVLLGGIPQEWCAPGKRVVADRLPVPGGLMSLELTSSTGGSALDISYVERGGNGARHWFVKFPRKVTCATVDGAPAVSESSPTGETWIKLTPRPGSTKLVFICVP